MKKHLFALILTLAALFSVTVSAGASPDTLRLVCRLRGVSYESMDDALSFYEEGDILELLMEVHHCQLSKDGDIRVRGVNGVQVPDDLFFVYLPQVLEHRVEGDIHIFTVHTLEPDPSWPAVLAETGTVPYGSVRTPGYWPGEIDRVEVSPYTGYEVVSLTVLDSQYNEIPSWRAEGPDYGQDVYYEFVLPAENLPVKLFAAIRPTGWTDENCPSRSFTDVEEDAWYHMAVDELVRRQILNGRTLHTIEPYGTLTRAEAVTILYRLMGSPAVTYTPVYTDVAEGEWYADPVSWATGEGIVNGVGNGLFAPDDLLTQEQLWVMLLRLSGDRVTISGGPDTLLALEAGDLDDYAADAFTWARTMGLEAAFPVHGLAVPTRAETAVTVYLYLLNRAKIAADPDLTYSGIDLNR